MAYKPEIQYVGQFYVYGSEAKQLAAQEQAKKAKTRLPLAKLEKIEQVYVDPVAIVGIAVAVVMLVAMVMGFLQIRAAWAEYEVMSDYLADLKYQCAEKEAAYRSHEEFDLAVIQEKALAMGMVPADQVQVKTITVTMPQPEPEWTWVDEVKWFLEGLL